MSIKFEYQILQLLRGDFVPFAENLKYCMDFMGYSNYRMAKILKCAPTTIANWISGERMPHKKSKEAIAYHFGISVEDLDGDGFPEIKVRKKEEPTDLVGGLSPLKQEAWELLQRSDDYLIKNFVEIMKAILEG